MSFWPRQRWESGWSSVPHWGLSCWRFTCHLGSDPMGDFGLHSCHHLSSGCYGSPGPYNSRLSGPGPQPSLSQEVPLELSVLRGGCVCSQSSGLRGGGGCGTDRCLRCGPASLCSFKQTSRSRCSSQKARSVCSSWLWSFSSSLHKSVPKSEVVPTASAGLGVSSTRSRFGIWTLKSQEASLWVSGLWAGWRGDVFFSLGPQDRAGPSRSFSDQRH